MVAVTVTRCHCRIDAPPPAQAPVQPQPSLYHDQQRSHQQHQQQRNPREQLQHRQPPLPPQHREELPQNDSRFSLQCPVAPPAPPSHLDQLEALKQLMIAGEPAPTAPSSAPGAPQHAPLPFENLCTCAPSSCSHPLLLFRQGVAGAAGDTRCACAYAFRSLIMRTI